MRIHGISRFLVDITNLRMRSYGSTLHSDITEPSRVPILVIPNVSNRLLAGESMRIHGILRFTVITEYFIIGFRGNTTEHHGLHIVLPLLKAVLTTPIK